MVIHIEGRVTHSSGQGLNGVSVTNGELIVQTDRDGTYAIEALPGVHAFIYLTVPDGYQPEGDFYHRLPATSGRIDFGLAPQPERARREFVMAQITDTHVAVEEDLSHLAPGDGHVLREKLAGDIAQLEAEVNPDLILATGDVTDYGSLPQLEAFKAVISSAQTPVFPGIGSHECNEESHGRPYRRHRSAKHEGDWLALSNTGVTCTRNYEKVLGPTHYSFDWGGRHFVFYSNEDYNFSAYDHIRKERWLWADLGLQPEGREIIMAIHMPPSRAFLDQLNAYNVKLMVHGHTHASKVFTYGKTLVASTPALCWGGNETNPRGYRVVRFKEQGFEVEFRPLGRPTSAVEAPREIKLGRGRVPLKLVWERKMPAHVHRAAPVNTDRDLLISLQDEDDGKQAGVCRVDGNTGELKWRVRTDSSVRNSVALAGDDRCIAVSLTGRLYSIDARTGAVMWEVDTPGFPGRWVATSPVIADETVYVGSKSGYGAYDLATGAQRWTAKFVGTRDLIADQIGDKWGSYASPVVYGELLVAFVPRRALVAMNRENGRIVWERELARTEDWWAAPILIPDKRPSTVLADLCQGSRRRRAATVGLWGDLLVSGGDDGELLLLRLKGGETLWHRKVFENRDYAANYVTGLAVEGDRIFAGTVHGQVLCCALHTGEVLWRFQSGDNLLDMAAHHRGISTVLAAPVFYADLVIACGVDGGLYMLDPESGECKSRGQFDAPISAAPCVMDDGFCVATWDGRLYRFAG